MSIIDALRRDHETIRELLDECEQAEEPAQAGDALARLRLGLMSHERAEEEILYSVSRTIEHTKFGTLAALEEHSVIYFLLDGLHGLDPAGERLKPRLEVLEEICEHHFEEEEEELFPDCEEALGPDRIAALEQPYADAKARIAEGKGNGKGKGEDASGGRGE